VIFTGRFGSGKSEIAINYALSMARAVPGSTKPQNQVVRPGIILIDLDIVTPYFRSRETAERIQALGVQVVSPMKVGQHLDTPAISPEILGAIQQEARPVVLDVGGDQQGARALGQYASVLEAVGYEMYFVVNPYRPFMGTAGIARAIAEIEASARLQTTALVSNPNLMQETDIETVLAGHQVVAAAGQALALPIAFLAIEESLLKGSEIDRFPVPVLPLQRFFVLPWEDSERAKERGEKGVLRRPKAAAKPPFNPPFLLAAGQEKRGQN